jgi:hypothetical protein
MRRLFKRWWVLGAAILPCALTIVAAPLGMTAASAAPSPIVFSGGPGTSAPPATLGPYSMTPFGADTQAVGATVSSATGPTGSLGFSPSLEHCLTPNPNGCWQTWSNGYSGDVYATSSGAITLTLPPSTNAFYFYAEPDEFETFSITATSSDGTTSGAIPVAGNAGAQYFGFYTTGSDPLTTITVSGDDPDGFAIGEFGVSTCGYHQPADWNTQEATSYTPGVEPLNVVISGCSDVSLGEIEQALPGWESVASPACLSAEKADVTGSAYVNQRESWRLDGCNIGNVISLFGNENHVRIWNQPIAGTKFGAWFIAASYETACVHIGDDMKPLLYHLNYLNDKSLLWHCIDGGKNADGTSSSFGSDGYDNGASSFVDDLKTAADDADWAITVQTDARPSGIGEGGVPFNGSVYVVTIDHGPQE